GLIAVGESLNELVGVGRDRRGGDLLVAGTGTPERNVFADGAAEHQLVLQNQADLLAQRLQRVVPDVLAIDTDLALARVIEARDQAHQGALAGAGGSDNRSEEHTSELQSR